VEDNLWGGMKDDPVEKSLDSLREFGIQIEPRAEDVEEASLRGAARRTSSAAQRLVSELLRYPKGEVEGRGGQFRPKRASGIRRLPDRGEEMRHLLRSAAKRRQQAHAAMANGMPDEAMALRQEARSLEKAVEEDRLKQERLRRATTGRPHEISSWPVTLGAVLRGEDAAPGMLAPARRREAEVVEVKDGKARVFRAIPDRGVKALRPGDWVSSDRERVALEFPDREIIEDWVPVDSLAVHGSYTPVKPDNRPVGVSGLDMVIVDPTRVGEWEGMRSPDDPTTIRGIWPIDGMGSPEFDYETGLPAAVSLRAAGYNEVRLVTYATGRQVITGFSPDGGRLEVLTEDDFGEENIDDLEVALESFDNWIAYVDPEDYLGPRDWSKEFWDHPTGLFHGTSEENAEEIKEEGLLALDRTRGSLNRFTGPAVFAHPYPEYALTYADGKIVAIDAIAMKEDGYLPEAGPEEPVREAIMREALAWSLGVEDYYDESPGWDGIDSETVVIWGSIPPKYLEILDASGVQEQVGMASPSGNPVSDDDMRLVAMASPGPSPDLGEATTEIPDWLQLFVRGPQREALISRGRSYSRDDSKVEQYTGFPNVPKMCYQNAGSVALGFHGDYPELTYVEGYAIPADVGIPLQHAWLVDKDGNVIDRTWRDGVAYFGIPIPSENLRRIVLRTGVWGVLNEAYGFPGGETNGDLDGYQEGVREEIAMASPEVREQGMASPGWPEGLTVGARTPLAIDHTQQVGAIKKQMKRLFEMWPEVSEMGLGIYWPDDNESKPYAGLLPRDPDGRHLHWVSPNIGKVRVGDKYVGDQEFHELTPAFLYALRVSPWGSPSAFYTRSVTRGEGLTPPVIVFSPRSTPGETTVGSHLNRTEQVRVTITHEFGHLVSDEILVRRHGPRLGEVSDEWSISQSRFTRMEDRLTELFDEYGITPEELATVSDYAATSPSEGFAELYAAAFSPALADELDLALRRKFLRLIRTELPGHHAPDVERRLTAGGRNRIESKGRLIRLEERPSRSTVAYGKRKPAFRRVDVDAVIETEDGEVIRRRLFDSEHEIVTVGMDSPTVEVDYDDPDSPNFYRKVPYEHPGSAEKHQENLELSIFDWVVFGAEIYPNNPIRWEIDNGDPGPGPFYRGQPPNLSLDGPRSWSRDPSVAVYHAPRIILSRTPEGRVKARRPLVQSQVAGEGEVLAVEILMTNDGPRPGFDLKELKTGYEWESEVVLDAANWPKGSHAAPIRIVIGGPGEAVTDEQVYEKVDRVLREEHGYTGPTLREPRQAAAMESPEFVSTEEADRALDASGDAGLWTDPDTRGRIVDGLLYYNGIRWSDGSNGIIARDRNGNAIGIIAYQVYTEEVAPGLREERLILTDIKVSPDHRRQGVGTNLVSEVRRLHPDLPFETNARTPDGEALFDYLAVIPIGEEYEDQQANDPPIAFPDWVVRENLKNASLKASWVEKDFERAEAVQMGMESPYAVMTTGSPRPVIYPLTEQEAASQANEWPNQPAWVKYVSDEDVERLRAETARVISGGMESPAFPRAAGAGARVGQPSAGVTDELARVTDAAIEDAIDIWPGVTDVAAFYWSGDAASAPFSDFAGAEGKLVGGPTGPSLSEVTPAQIVSALEGDSDEESSASRCLQIGTASGTSRNIIIYWPGHATFTTASMRPSWAVFNRLTHRKAQEAGRSLPTPDDGTAAYPAIVLHEIGHAVANTIIPPDGSDPRLRSRKLIALLDRFGITPEEITAVSEYATTTPDEAFAELYSLMFSEMVDEMDPSLRLKFGMLLTTMVPGHKLPTREASMIAAMDSPELAFPGAAAAGLAGSAESLSRRSLLQALDNELERIIQAWPGLPKIGRVFVSEDTEPGIPTIEGNLMSPSGVARMKPTALAITLSRRDGSADIVMRLDKDPWQGTVNNFDLAATQIQPRPSMNASQEERTRASDEFWRLALLHEVGHVVQNSIVAPLKEDERIGDWEVRKDRKQDHERLTKALLQRYGITPEEIARVSLYATASPSEAFAEIFTMLMAAPELLDPVLREKFIALLESEVPGFDLSAILGEV